MTGIEMKANRKKTDSGSGEDRMRMRTEPLCFVANEYYTDERIADVVFTGRVIMLCLYRLSYDFPFERDRHQFKFVRPAESLKVERKRNCSVRNVYKLMRFSLYTNN